MPAQRWYRDFDGDGYGDWYEFLDSSAQPDGYVDNNWDCHDGVAEANPEPKEDLGYGMASLPSGAEIPVDLDCDSLLGEDNIGEGNIMFYPDLDEDGHGTSDDPNHDPVAVPFWNVGHWFYPGGWTVDGVSYHHSNDDCDDSDPTNQACPEIDEPLDRDGDGFVDYLRGGDDCDDFDAARHPGGGNGDPFGKDKDCIMFPNAVVTYETPDPRGAAPTAANSYPGPNVHPHVQFAEVY